MQLLSLTLASPAENLALDEALLNRVDEQDDSADLLRLWEPMQSMVVLGRSSHGSREVKESECRRLNIPILRRSSGGATIVTGPGCLMYALILHLERHPQLRAVDQAHRFVLDGMVSALRPHVPEVQCLGTSDLAIGDPTVGSHVASPHKFSGNSLRCKRNAILYHGTILYDFPLHLISQCLAMPPRQPDYRQGRPHETFVSNLELAPETLRQALIDGWQAKTKIHDWPRQDVAHLVQAKYGTDAWNAGL